MESGARKNKYKFISDMLDKTSFMRIFVIWLITLVIFSLIYKTISATSGTNYLIGKEGNKITGFSDYVYYSFITATSTGYGDITPKGITMKTLAIFNVVIGVVIMAVITSKLVSMRQEKLLEQIYHLSLSEKINRLVSGLAVFKGEANRILGDMESNTIDRKDLFSIKMSLASLKHNINEIKTELLNEDEDATKTNIVQIEQILSGVSQVFEKLEKMTDVMNKKDVTFKNASLLEEIYAITNMGDVTLNSIKKMYPLYTSRVDEVMRSTKKIKSQIMEFKIIDTANDIEINLSPELLVGKAEKSNTF